MTSIRSTTVVLLLISAGTAQAYVRTRTSTGTPVEWRSKCPDLVLEASENPDFKRDRLRDALQKSVQGWDSGAQTCARVQIGLSPGSITHDQVQFDGQNVVMWRLPGFCHSVADSGICANPSIIALTTVFYYDKPGQPDDGELLEADMELNAITFQFADDGAPDEIDMQGVLTHEVGHFLGFDHSCSTIPGVTPPVDDGGTPVLPCSPREDLPANVIEATMYPYQDPGDLGKRLPGPDELRGICHIYASLPRQCMSDPGCTLLSFATRGPSGPSLAILLLLFVTLVVSRRTLRRRGNAARGRV